MPSAESAYLFRHALLRDAAYQLQLPGDRVRLHALAVQSLEDLSAANPDLADLWAEDCFIHCSAVAAAHENVQTSAGFDDRALGHALRAAAYFDRGQRLGDAVRFYTLAADHAACSPEARSRSLSRLCAILAKTGPNRELRRAAEALLVHAQGVEEQAEALTSLAHADTVNSDILSALARIDQALALPGLAVGSERWIKLKLRRATYLVRLNRNAEALAALEECRPHLKEGSASRAQWLGVSGRVYRAVGELHKARTAMLQAQEHLARAGERATHAVLTGELAAVEEKLGNLGEAERLYSSAIAQSANIGDSLHELIYRHNLASLMMQTGRRAEAVGILTANIQGARERGLAKVVLGGALALAECLRRDGREAAAADLLWSLRSEPMEESDGERGKYLYYATSALSTAGRHAEVASFADAACSTTFSAEPVLEFNRYFTFARIANALFTIGEKPRAVQLAKAAMEEAARLRLTERFRGDKRHPIFGEICAILGMPEPE